MNEIGNISNRLRVYKNNVRRLKLKQEQSKKITHKKVKIYFKNKYKKESKISMLFLMLFGFIFGLFENIANKKIKSDNEQSNFKLHKDKVILVNYKTSKNYGIKKIVINQNALVKNENNIILSRNLNNSNEKNTNVNFINNVEVKTFKSNLAVPLNNKVMDEKPQLKSIKVQNKNTKTILNIKLQKNKKNDSIIPVLLNPSVNINRRKLKLQNDLPNKKQDKIAKKKIEANNDVILINKPDIEKGSKLIKKALKKQEEQLKEINEKVSKFNYKIKDNLKINYFSRFITNTAKFLSSLLPIGVMQNKLFGSLISSILLNNSIKSMRSINDLKYKALYIVPDYLNQIKTEEDCIQPIIDVCIDSKEQFSYLKTEFLFNNKKYSKTIEYQNALKKINELEDSINKQYEEAKKLDLKVKKIKKESNEKIYKIIKR